MNTRNSYLVSRAFKNYFWASLLSSATIQAAMTVDAIVVGNYIGAEALSAINLMMPLTTLVAALSTLIGLGPAIMASKAISCRNHEKVDMVFTSAICQGVIIGLVVAVGITLFSADIATQLCHDAQIYPYLVDYLRVIPWGFCLTILTYSLVSLMEADGHPRLATKALLVGCITNIVLDILFVRVWGMGIQGAAWANVVNNLLVTLFFFLRFRREGVSYHWLWPNKNIVNVTLAGMREGLPMMVNDLAYSLMLLMLNNLMLAAYGSQGVFFWSICVQLLLLAMVVVDGAEGALLSIGSMLVSGNDKNGFRMFVHRLVAVISVITVLFTLFIWQFPEGTARMFSESSDDLTGWDTAVRAFSLMLLPYVLSVFMRSFFQVSGHRFMGVLFTLAQMVAMVGGLWMAIRWVPHAVWWSFPVSITLLSLVQFGVLCLLDKRRRKGNGLLSPAETEKTATDLSVGYTTDAVLQSIDRVRDFLEQHRVPTQAVMCVNICCEELMLNIVRYQPHKRNPYMDLHVAVTEHKVTLVLKDAGRPFNPVVSLHDISLQDAAESHLGLMMVNSVCTTLTHKYMYGQNVVFAEFDNV